MKKFRPIFLLVLAFAFIFTGCGAKGDNLKLVESTKSASSFYFDGAKEIAFIEINAATALQESEFMSYMMFMSMALQGQTILNPVVSAMDFCMAIAEEEISSDTTQKVYHYEAENLGLQSEKSIVMVEKKKGKSLYTTKEYTVQQGEELQLSELAEQQPNSTYNLSVSRDKSQGLYEFSDSANKISGDFKYQKNSGKFIINISFYTNSFGPEQKFDVCFELYAYENKTVGGRMTTKTTLSAKNETFVYEFLSKPFQKKSKMGIVKDPKLMLDLTQITEDDFAKANEGDLYGYSVTYDNQIDTQDPKTTVKHYGIFPI